MNNLYWTIYKNLENELMSMTYQIHFDDEQINVYSEKFIDILLRTSIEIEALSKELYLSNGGNPIEKEQDMYFDTVCLDYLENQWQLSRKEVSVTGFNFFFEKEENIKLTPLKKANKRGDSGSDWKKAYQAVKHNRNSSYKKANMKTCIQALAALFILNLYYKFNNKEISCGTEINPKEIDENFGSSIFTPNKSRVVFDIPTGNVDDKSKHEKSVFLLVYSNKTYNDIINQAKDDFQKKKEFLSKSEEYKNFFLTHPDYNFENQTLEAIAHLVGGEKLKNQLIKIPYKSITMHINSTEKYVLNKNQCIYYKE